MTVLSTPFDKITALRAELTRLGVDGFIVSHADEYQSEYLPPYAERLDWLTGFSGSNGVAAILADRAVCLTDGRYLIQIEQQVERKLYETGDMTKAGISDWLAQNVRPGQKIGYDPKLHTPSQVKALVDKLTPKGIELITLPENPLDKLWQRDKGEILQAEPFPEEIAGKNSAYKRAAIAADLKEKGVNAAVITLSDSIAWLLNIRGQDIPHNPLVLSYAILHAEDARLDWFVDPAKITPEVSRHLGNTVMLYDEERFADGLKELTGNVIVDFDHTSQWVVQTLLEGAANVANAPDPSILPKAIKTPQEQAAMRAAHIRDGVALTKFLHWFSLEAPKGQLTELSASEKLLSFRAQQKDFRMTSFDTISSWGANSAVVHYQPTPESNLPIKGDGLYLLDSGGQYNDGTTDVTRTVGVGKPSEEMKRSFTLVMKSHITLAKVQFPEGTTGAQLDGLTRMPLWEQGLDFAHGTGHGVGVYLCVHEESVRISPRGHGPAKPGMIVSNEPGFYKTGAYGIRCESLILCQETGKLFGDGRKMLNFETITLAPFDRSLILEDMLTADEKAWLTNYQQRVYDTLSPFLDGMEKTWLKAQI